MLHRNLRLIEEDTFELGFKLQTEWAWLITTAFFLGELGAGLFLVSLFLSGKVAIMSALVGWIFVTVGKNIAHLLFLGKPLRFWRGIWRPQTSWISRGFVAMLFMIIFGALHIIFSYKGIVSPVSIVVTWIAGFSAFVVMIYDGIVMTYSPSIPLWNNALLPLLRVSYALMGGVTIALFIAGIPNLIDRFLSFFSDVILISGVPGLASMLNDNLMHILKHLETWLIIANLVMIIIYILTMIYSIDAAKKSAYLIFKEKYPIVFWLGVIFLGLVVIFLLPVIVTTPSIPILLAVAGCELIGDYCILFLLLRSGVFSPLMPHPNIDITLFAET
ncbi:MAG TPA: DmsC/YnfH family molybdoenzyme membrane anchor subunit [Syntrophales bacterium]|nr:DmsC/YnfH family molybdoenzyme membrane anchor subunit [Syntrophales bacterium]